MRQPYQMTALLEALAGGMPPSYARALRAGAAADRVGHAFAAGYQAALRALVPDLPEAGVASLAATEPGGAHPRAIATTLAPAAGGDFILRGHKTFATQGPDADVFLVLANAGPGGSDRLELRVARVARGAAGLTIEPAPPLPFCPEIGHAQLRFADVAVGAAELVPGDGWTDLVKPFRTVEDVHVHGALLAYVLGVATRHDWPHEAHEQLAALLLGFAALAARAPSAPATHVALAGAIALARRTLDAHAGLWQRVGDDERARWLRDQPLLQVAEKARGARRDAAWRDL